mgnify:CR=1 FL=1
MINKQKAFKTSNYCRLCLNSKLAAKLILKSIPLSEKFSTKPSVAPRTKKGSSLAITIILDKASIELFFDEGETVMTEIFFTKAPFETFRLETSRGTATIGNLEIKELMKK